MKRIYPLLLIVMAVLVIAFQNFSFVPSKRPTAIGPLNELDAMELDAMELDAMELDALKPKRNSELWKAEAVESSAAITGASGSSGQDSRFNPDFLGANASFDIRELAPAFGETLSKSPIGDGGPARPWGFAETPMPNADLGSVGQALLEREVRPSLRPYEEMWVGKINRYIAGFVPIEGEDWPDAESESSSRGSDSDRAPAGMPAIPGLPPEFGLPGNPETEQDSTESGPFSWRTYRPRDIRMTKANEITFSFARQTRLSYELGSQGGKFQVSRPLSTNTNLNMNHETNDQKNSLGLQISW